MEGDTLSRPRRVAIIGGGPAGSLSAILLLRRARELGRELQVTILDRKQFGITGPRGCNMCAGIVSDSLIRRLDAIGIEIPDEVIQRRIEAYVVEAGGVRVRLPKPPGARIYAAFRSGGPMGEEFGSARSFDHLLRQAAITAGACHVPRVVRGVTLPASRQEPVVVWDEQGDEHPADVVIGAFGVNSRMVRVFEELGFGYRGPRTAMACQGEIPLTSADIDALFGNDVQVFMVGIGGVRLAAMVPKQRHVTATLIGHEVGEGHLKRFLQTPEVRAHLPPGWQLPARYCHCHPRLPISMARAPVTDRIVVVGDACVSRYLKNGLDSAFTTASLAAEAILSGGVSRANLMRSYVGPCRRIFGWDNLCGRALFGMHSLAGELPRVAAAQLRLAQREQEAGGPAPLCQILWDMLTGDERYCVVLRRLLAPGLQARLAWELLRALGGSPSQTTSAGGGPQRLSGSG